MRAERRQRSPRSSRNRPPQNARPATAHRRCEFTARPDRRATRPSRVFLAADLAFHMAPGATSSATPEFQAVILASGNDGDNLYPLTEHAPPALLPVANRPLLSFQLELLERAAGFQTVFVLATETYLAQLSKYVSELYKGALQVELVKVPEGLGSAPKHAGVPSLSTMDRTGRPTCYCTPSWPRPPQ